MSESKGPFLFGQLGRPPVPDAAQLLQKALGLHQLGLLAEAEPHYRAILAQLPHHFDALHLLGVIAYQRQDFEGALRLIGRALQIDPNNAAAHSNIGSAWRGLKRHDEALASYDRALALMPGHVEALHNRGIVLHDLGRDEAALASYERVLALRPGHAEALAHRGASLAALGRTEAALASLERALALKPGDAAILHGHGTALAALGRHEAALVSYDRALALKPDFAEALSNRGTALRALKRPEEALASYDRALALRPDYAEVLNNRGTILVELRRAEEALASYDRALALLPDHVEFHNNRGTALFALKRHDEALASYRQALLRDPDFAGALNNRGLALRQLDRHEEAAREYEKLLRVAPDFPEARGDLLNSKLHCCDWERYGEQVELITNAVAAGALAVAPFIFLTMSDSPADQQQCAQINSRKFLFSEPAVWRGERYRHDRIRIAYLSADYRNHPAAYSAAELFETHDRARFETTALSFGPAHKDEMRLRLEGAFTRFIDVRDTSDRDVALLMKELEIDIAVDLMGYTGDSRPGILAHRPAPVQVNYFGYAGTMGASHIDYILADRIVIPEAQRAAYTESVVYLPDTYYPNDAKRRISAHTPTRQGVGLPETGFVFCAFNNNHKITPPVFDVWMRLLHQVEGSVLWLLAGNEAAIRNLRRNAEIRGIAPDRLVFAPRIRLEDHLARHRLAGFLLDNLPYNAHTTATDALSAGLPVVTCIGASFAGRVAASLLHAVGLPELITGSLDDYEALALALALDPDRLAAIKAKLAAHRASAPLFDTPRLCRHIESAYDTMWQRSQKGEAPAGFAVAAD